LLEDFGNFSVVMKDIDDDTNEGVKLLLILNSTEQSLDWEMFTLQM
jgi:hypothetical protein